MPRLPTPPRLTIVQAEQAPAEATNQEIASTKPRFNPAWKEMYPDPRKRIVAMAKALDWRKITTSQGETFGGSEAFWNLKFSVTALSYIMTALEAEFER